MSARIQINLETKFDQLIAKACREGYEQAIAQGDSEQEATDLLHSQIQKKVIEPFFQSEEFKSAYDNSGSSAKKPTPLQLAKMRYQEVAGHEIRETIKSAWQMAIELKKWNEQEAKGNRIKAKKLTSNKEVAPKSSYKTLFGKKI